jgi:hypothetical protein
MFRASSCPSSGATTTAVAASGLQLERGDSSAVGRGRPTPYVYQQSAVCLAVPSSKSECFMR